MDQISFENQELFGDYENFNSYHEPISPVSVSYPGIDGDLRNLATNSNNMQTASYYDVKPQQYNNYQQINQNIEYDYPELVGDS